jgi:hypothetical protein
MMSIEEYHFHKTRITLTGVFSRNRLNPESILVCWKYPLVLRRTKYNNYSTANPLKFPM